jgi:hypothetical protein
MRIIFEKYHQETEIPVRDYLKQKKFSKYFNRETAAAIITSAKLFKQHSVEKTTPIYYSSGVVEYEDYGLNKIYEACVDENETFSEKLFIEKGMYSVSPLTQFKVLYNMPLCFISIENNLQGDSAVVYASASGLLANVMYAPTDSEIIVGAGKVYENGSVESAFAIINKQDIQNSKYINSETEAITMLNEWHQNGGVV